jgi:hypothetical protein
MNSNLMSKVGRDSRFTADSVGKNAQTPVEVGPGSYSARNWGTSIAEDQVKRGSLTSRIQAIARPALAALGFNSRYRQRELPFELDDRNTQPGVPGPGSYDPQVTEVGSEACMSVRKGAELMRSSSFAPGHIKGAMASSDHMGDPGAYNPNHNRTIAHDTAAEKTFNTLMQTGKGGFGAQQERELTLAPDFNGEHQPTNVAGIQATPGPAGYTPLLTETGREAEMSVRNGVETMPMAVFQSKVARIGDITPHAMLGNPGPGTYDPNPDILMHNLPGQNMNSNLMSKVGRDSRFTADIVGNAVSTPDQVGPGLYSPKATNDGTLNTITSRVDKRSMKTEDAVFSSNADRNLLEWFLDEFGNFSQGTK